MLCSAHLNNVVQILVCITMADSNSVTVELPGGPEAAVGQYATLLCKVSGSLTIKGWKKNGATLKLDNSLRIQTNADKSTVLIDPLVVQDDGPYQCTATTAQKKVFDSDPVQLKVLVQPTIFPRGDTVIKGRKATLDCSGTDMTRVEWYFRGVALHGQRRYALKGLYGEFLEIPLTTKADAGQYNCIAVNKFPVLTTSKFLSLVVEYFPIIISHPVNLTAFEGYDVRMSCNVSALPTAQVFWKKDGVNVESLGSRFVVTQPTEKSGQLLIESVQSSDAGRYSCLANSSISPRGTWTESKKAQLQVQGGCQSTNGHPLKKTLLLDSNATIDCCSKEAIPDGVLWAFGDNILISSGQRIVDGSSKLTIRQATYDLSGTYGCQFSKKLSAGSSKFVQRKIAVTVRGPPFTPQTPNVTVTVNNYSSAEAFLAWNTPFNGNSQITGYVIDSMIEEDVSAQKSQWISNKIQGFPLNNFHYLSLDVNVSLVNAFHVCISAFNAHGLSEKSDIVRVDSSVFKKVTDASTAATPSTTESRINSTVTYSLHTSDITPSNAFRVTPPEQIADKNLALMLGSGISASGVLFLASVVIGIIIWSKRKYLSKIENSVVQQPGRKQSRKQRNDSERTLVSNSSADFDPDKNVFEQSKDSRQHVHQNVSLV